MLSPGRLWVKKRIFRFTTTRKGKINFFRMLYISNFVLDFSNKLKYLNMKRSFWIFLVVALVVFSSGAWLLNSSGSLPAFEIIQFGVIGLLIVFAAYFGFTRLRSERRGEPAEDEMTRKEMQKTASLSYFISLYLWVVILYLKDRIIMDIEVWIGTGIMGMALTFGIVWVIIHVRGLRNE
jgi:hypothetical protein